MADQLITLS